MEKKFKNMAIWVWPVSVRNEDPEIMVERAKEAKINILIPYICGHRANVHEAERDVERYDEKLRQIIEIAHKNGLKVYACFDEINAYPEMPVYNLRQVRKDGSYGNILCPANPVVVEYILEKLRYVLKEFDYDGINLEDGYVYNNATIYDPAHQIGEEYRIIPVCYCEYCQKKAPIEKDGWDEWKREKLNILIEKESRLIRSIKNIPFSVAARMPYSLSFYEPYKNEIPYYEGWKYCQSRDSYCADWVEWVRRNYIDFACPMSYYHSSRIVELQTIECQSLIKNNDSIWMGIGLGKITVEYRQDKKHHLHNDGKNIEILLKNQLLLGQKNVVFFCYQHLWDEHIPVISKFR